MNPLPFIVAAYAIAILVPAALGLAARARMHRAARRLSFVDPRAARRRAGQAQ